MLNNINVSYKVLIIYLFLLTNGFKLAYLIKNGRIQNNIYKIKHLFISTRPSMKMSTNIKRKKIDCHSEKDIDSNICVLLENETSNDSKSTFGVIHDDFILSDPLQNEKAQHIESLSDDEILVEGCKFKLESSKKVKTVEELESYFRLEERTKVIIDKSKIPLFAQNDLFRNVVRNKANCYSSYLNDEGSIRSYLLQRWDELPESLQRLIATDAIRYYRIYQKITYDDLTAQEAFKLVSNDDDNFMIGFETVGHIAHLNITEEREASKALIAKIIIDKFNNIKTVVNKRSELSNEFRTIDIEHLAGEKNYVTSLIENGFKFELDYENVYWNSRLIQERNRISGLISMNDIVVDMFAGVGPFAIYASKKKCHVFANDLNPIGVEYMNRNVKLNKVEDLVKTYNMDAREFLDYVIKKNKILDKSLSAFEDFRLDPNANVHFIMNLPKLAITYLDAFVGLADNTPEDNVRKCLVHCYCFEKTDEFKEEIERRLKNVVGGRIKEYEITEVRNVSPNKHMYCIEFECPMSMLTNRAD